MLQAQIFTLYPEIFPGPFDKGLYGKAMAKKLWSLKVINIRDAATDKHKTVDDTPYGGGTGMLLKPDILAKSIDQNLNKGERIFYLSPKGKRFDQNADYNNSTYVFTAPVTGKYQLNVHLLVEEVQITPTYYQLKLTTSNKLYYETFDPRGFDQSTSYYCLQSSPLADMDAGDTAYVAIYQQGGNATSDINGTTALFNGYLVC